MNKTLLLKIPKFATMAYLECGKKEIVLISHYVTKGELVEEIGRLEDEVISTENGLGVPVSMFAMLMQAYLTYDGNTVTIEHSGHIVTVDMCKERVGYVDAIAVLSKLNINYSLNEDGKVLEFIVEAIDAGPRELTSSEEKLPYAKYYHRYWETPYHLRADVIAWSKKFANYQVSTMRRPEEMLHIHDTRKLLDPNFRENQWNEGWTLFPDGSGVMCVKTEFPGTTCEAFQWWFAWHVLEDIRYMLWYPPAHYGIRPSSELRNMLADPDKSVFEKTHGGNAVHLVYESTQIDSNSCVAAGPVAWHPIPFHDPQKRGFTDEDVASFEKKKIVALCGGTRMLHFFVENEEGTGGTLFTHFWYGLVPDENLGWVGTKDTPDESWIPNIMNIGQHATKEFANLARILPEIYAEEGGKNLV